MPKICPQCGREYFGQTMKCIHCHCALVEKTTASVQPRQTERQITAQMNEQKNQKKRELQGKEKQQQTKITQPKPSKSSTGKNSNLGTYE